mgnify:FL=1
MSVRVRFAPSPTGAPHVGNIRTALFNWLFARNQGGVFVLRIEDTDRERIVPGALEAIYEALRWLGLDWDEGPEKGGPYGPYIQSQRLHLYRPLAERLVAEGKAYRCYCSRERLEALRAEQIAHKQPPGYDRRCRWLSPAERAALEAQGTPFVIRFAVPLEGATTFHDLFRGPITFENSVLQDHVLIKSDGWPTYHFANVVDDHLMAITHVLRAEEWISSTPLHVLLYRAFGWEPPAFGHLSLIFGKDRKKLSKRHGATEILTFKKLGYLPEALFNFLALLGWSMPGKGETEIYSREEIIRNFTLDRITVSPAIFDYEKLDWMNGYYIRQLSVPDLTERLIPFLQEAGLLPPGPVAPETRAYLEQIVPLIQERIKRLGEAPELVDFFFREPQDYPPTLLIVKGTTPEMVRTALERTRAVLERTDFTVEGLEMALRALAPELGLTTSQLFGIIRVAVTGRTVAPPLFQTMAVLGRERTLARLERARQLLAALTEPAPPAAEVRPSE